jgi:hypothetical protein
MSCVCSPPPGRRPSVLAIHANKGIFLGYGRTLEVFLYYDLVTNIVKFATHGRFDEGMNDEPLPNPNVEALSRAQGRPIPAETKDLPLPDFDLTSDPFLRLVTENVAVTCTHPTLGLEIRNCSERLRGYLPDVERRSTAESIRTVRRRYISACICKYQRQHLISADANLQLQAVIANYSFRNTGERKSRNCCDGSPRAAPKLRWEQTYAS